MFGYVNLIIMKLLMMKSLAQDAYIWIIVFWCKVGVKWYCSCCFVDDFMIYWCCCCYEMLLLWIHAMDIHDYEACDEIWVVVESFMKNGLEMNKLILLSRIKLFMMRLMYKWLDHISMKNWVCLSLILNLEKT